MPNEKNTIGGKKPSSVRRASFVEQYKEVFWSMGLVAIVVALIVVAVLTTVNRVAPEEIAQNIVENFGPDTPRHPLTGEVLEEELDVLPQVFGVMVENSAEAWPLVGLDKAFLVIEAPVEADIPRFLVFSHEESGIEKLGPVRSTRPYYIDWNDELDAVYAHVGGSPEALELIRDVYDTIDLNQFFQSEYFYRQTTGGRYAPHNVFTDGELLAATLDELDLDVPDYESWRFQEGESRGNASIKVDWTDGVTYDIDWQYDVSTNQYTRFQGLSMMRMEDGSTIQADNVVVVATDVKVIDGEGRKELRTTGEGDAYMAQNGEVFLVRWKKDDRTDRLRFYTQDGHEITMNAGVTWIEIVEELSQAEQY